MGVERGRPTEELIATLLASGDYERAIEVISEALESGPVTSGRRVQLADALALAGRRVQAVEILEQEADRAAREGFTTKAQALFKRILKIDPTRRDITGRLEVRKEERRGHSAAETRPKLAPAVAPPAREAAAASPARLTSRAEPSVSAADTGGNCEGWAERVRAATPANPLEIAIREAHSDGAMVAEVRYDGTKGRLEVKEPRHRAVLTRLFERPLDVTPAGGFDEDEGMWYDAMPVELAPWQPETLEHLLEHEIPNLGLAAIVEKLSIG
jgi:tetratricopeptide (TPR) repeat protein